MEKLTFLASILIVIYVAVLYCDVRLPLWYANSFKKNIFRFIILLVVVYFSEKDFKLGLLLSLAYVANIIKTNTDKIENFEVKSEDKKDDDDSDSDDSDKSDDSGDESEDSENNEENEEVSSENISIKDMADKLHSQTHTHNGKKHTHNFSHSEGKGEDDSDNGSEDSEDSEDSDDSDNSL